MAQQRASGSASPYLHSKQARFSQFYFFVIGYLAFPLVLIPLLGDARGFDAGEIAWLGIASTVAYIIGGPVILQLAATRFSGRKLVQSGLLICFVSLASLLFTRSFSLFLSGWFLNQLSLQCYAIVDARAIRLAANKEIVFEHVRLFGSLGFIVLSLFFGFSLDVVGVDGSLLVAAGFVLLLFCFFQRVKADIADFPTSSRSAEISSPQQASPVGRAQILSLPVLCLLLLNMILWASHSPFYLYYSVYLKTLGWSGTSISAAWIVGVVCEILLFWLIPRFCNTPRAFAKLLIVGTVATVLRWFLLSISSHSLVLILTQSLHAFTWGAVYLSSMKLVFHFLPESHKDRGQGWVQAIGVGVGRLVGNLYFGFHAATLASYAEIPALFSTTCILALCCLPLSMLINSQVRQSISK